MRECSNEVQQPWNAKGGFLVSTRVTLPFAPTRAGRDMWWFSHKKGGKRVIYTKKICDKNNLCAYFSLTFSKNWVLRVNFSIKLSLRLSFSFNDWSMNQTFKIILSVIHILIIINYETWSIKRLQFRFKAFRQDMIIY